MTTPRSTAIWQAEFAHGRVLRLRAMAYALWLLAACIVGYVR